MTRGDASGWTSFMRQHKSVVAVFVVACVAALSGAVYVFWWFTGIAQTTGLVPASLGQWTMGSCVAFILNAIFWELLLIGVPVVVGSVIGFLWWRRLPYEERERYRLGGGAKTGSGSGGVSLLFFIAFCIKVYLDGNWNVPISAWSLSYVVGSVITILVWVAVIFGIPGAIVAIWWMRRGKASPE